MYKALDKATDSLVAIKVIPLTEQDKEDFASIQKEIAFLSDCNHPNIVKYLVRACCESCVHGGSTAGSFHVQPLVHCPWHEHSVHALDHQDDVLRLPCMPQGSYRHSTELWIVMEYCGGGSVSDLIQARCNELHSSQPS